MIRIQACSFAALGALVGALFVAGCSGKTASSGAGTQSQGAQSVGASEVSGPVTACAAGQAHPNVCCHAGPGEPSACEVRPDSPFQACAAGTVTFPDPRSCCPLDASGECVKPPSTGPTPPIDPWCIYPCPVGMYEPSTQPGVCCETAATGGPICHGGPGGGGGSGGWVDAGAPQPGTNANGSAASGGPSTGGGGVTGGSSSGSTGGSSGGGTGSSSGGPSTGDAGIGCACPTVCEQGGPCPPPCDCPPPPPPPVCGVCPPGWQVPQGDPFLCCREEQEGVIECFSRGVPPPPPPVDAGPPICDPNGPAPNPACTWDLKTCQWDCPVCDPSGPAPNPSCKWDSTACAWLCL